MDATCFLLDLSPIYFTQPAPPIPLPHLLNSLLRSIFQIALRNPDTQPALYLCLPIGAIRLSPADDDYLYLKRFQFAEFREVLFSRIEKKLRQANQDNLKLISAIHNLKKSSLV